MLSYDILTSLLRGRDQADTICPLCSSYRKRENRKKRVLRLWRMDGAISFHCAHCSAAGIVHEGRHNSAFVPRSRAGNGSLPGSRPLHRHVSVIEPERQARVTALWEEGLPPRGTWVEDYLRSRQLTLPADASMIRCHPECPFPDRRRGPAMLIAWTSFRELVEGEAEAPVALHRIRGRGGDNKAMLGPTKHAAMMLTAPYLIGAELGVCEGFETGLALSGRRPIWALGSAGAMARFPVVARVERLTIFADRDPTGVAAAQALAERYRARGRQAIIKLPPKGDFADA